MANILSVSKIYDNDLIFQFAKRVCLAFNKKGEQLMGGVRTLNTISIGLWHCFGPKSEMQPVDAPKKSVEFRKMGFWV